MGEDQPAAWEELGLCLSGAPSTMPNAGTYSESVTFSPINTLNYNTVSTTVNVTINKATGTVALTNLNQAYSGSGKTVTASTAPSGMTVNMTYNGSPNAPTNAGSYNVIGTISNPNYQGSATNTLIIGMQAQSFRANTTNSNKLLLQLSGTPNYPYILQMATNLASPIWQPVYTNPADVNGNWNATVTNMQNRPAGYYRAAGQ